MNSTQSILEGLKRHGLKQVAIHKRTGIPQPRLSKWLRKGVPPAVDDALRLQALLQEVEAEAHQGVAHG